MAEEKDEGPLRVKEQAVTYQVAGDRGLNLARELLP
jgi:hypothetical protein